MLRLAISSIRGRLTSFSGAVLAIVFTASLIVASGVLMESALRSDSGGTTRFEAASAIVKARPLLEMDPELVEDPEYDAAEQPPVPAELVDRIGDLPGVELAVGDVAFSAQVVDRAGNPLVNASGGPSVGHAWSSAVLAPFVLQAGQEPLAPGEVVLDADLAQRAGYQVGDDVQIITPAGTQTFSLAGIAAPPGSAGFEEQSALFFAEETARELAPFPDRFASVGILTDPALETGALKQQLSELLDEDRYEVLSGDEKREAEQLPHQIPVDDTMAFLGTAAGITGFVMIFVVANTFSYSVQQRGREIGLLRAVAATPRQIRRMIISEAAVIAIFGSAVGSLLGLVLAWPIRWTLIQVNVAPPDMAMVYGPTPIVSAIVASLLIAEIAVFFASRRAARILPSSALREASIERRRVGKLRLISGLLLGIGALISFSYLMQVGGEAGAALSLITVMILCVASALLGPVLVWPVGWIVGGLLSLVGGATGQLARANVLANRRRSASVAVPLLLTACFATLFLFIGTVQEFGVASHTHDRMVSDYVVVSNASPGLPPSAAAAIQDLPEVDTATGTLSTGLTMNITPIGSEYSDLTEVPARGVDPEPLTRVLDLGITDGALDELDGNRVAISDLVARGRGLEIGDEATMWLPDGSQITPRVVAIYTNSMGFADILLPRETLEQHTSEQLNAEVFVTTVPGSSPEEFQSAVAGLQSEIPTLEVIDRAAYTEILNEDIRQNSRVTYLLAGLAAIYTAIAIVNTLMMSISERTREFARLRMIGSTRRQVVMMVILETIIIIALGVGLGVGISLLANIGFTSGLLGYQKLVIPWFSFLAILAGVILLGFAASTIPTLLANRSQPRAATGGQD